MPSEPATAPKRPSPPSSQKNGLRWPITAHGRSSLRPNKDGVAIEALTREGGLILAAEDGNELTYVADGAITEEALGNRAPEEQQVLATRGAREWTSQDIATPSSAPEGVSAGNAPEHQFPRQDLSYALVEPWGTISNSEPPLAPEATQKTIYLRDNATGTYLPLVTEANAPDTHFGGDIEFAGATPDLSHVLIESHIALMGGSSAPGLYESVAGKLQFVSVLPGERLHIKRRSVTTMRPLTRSRATARGSSGPTLKKLGPGHLYMRDTATGETIQLDVAQGAPQPPGAGTAQFQTASSDGSRYFSPTSSSSPKTQPQNRDRKTPGRRTCTSAK